jgi:hypothetical protein
MGGRPGWAATKGLDVYPYPRRSGATTSNALHIVGVSKALNLDSSASVKYLDTMLNKPFNFYTDFYLFVSPLGNFLKQHQPIKKYKL